MWQHGRVEGAKAVPEESKDRAYVLAGPDDDAMEQMRSSAREESAASKDGLEVAEVVAGLVDNGVEYFNRDDVVIGRPWVDGRKKHSVAWTESNGRVEVIEMVST